MKHPTLSVIIPVFNRENLIINTLISIQSQTFKDWECIVVDDGSTDNTKDVIQDFVKRDKRFTLLNNTRKKGAQGARNVGLLYSTGEYLSFFDSDDLMHPQRLSKQINYLKENPVCDVCTCYSHLLNDKNEIIGAFTWITKGNILKDLLKGSTYVDYNSAVIRRSVLDRIEYLDENCPSFQEWDTHIRIASYAIYGTIHEILVSYFQRSTGRISNDNKRELHGLTYIYAKHRELWIETTGKHIYLSKIYDLASRISLEDKIFQRDMIKILPALQISRLFSMVGPLLTRASIRMYQQLKKLLAN